MEVGVGGRMWKKRQVVPAILDALELGILDSVAQLVEHATFNR